MALTYLDTSALAKWYLNEPRANEFSTWIQEQDDTHISSLTVTEFRCLLARRRRTREFSMEIEQWVFATFEMDIHDGHLIVHPLNDLHASGAVHLINSLPTVALRSLDAMHLSIARDIGARVIVTADRVMVEAANLLGFQVVRFD
ncbi:hypothetical protein PN36_11100 [Candidatus Thiomargarita nelsonii]|uniref:PIN domain-containing protein n=1 Tax=Candidatus Thiomargarita nelsonii TaxID=1003181 RepID=A0A0A6PDA1_9GAMM|nr:hypothetical protein PN36_11100 [Candidatus Thiomargarita nelsonii]